MAPAKNKKILNTGADLYKEMTNRGLELRNKDGRDNALFKELIKNLKCPNYRLMDFLKSNDISAEKFLIEFLKVSKPFAQMFHDIWRYLSKKCAPIVSENETITVRFGLPDEKTFDTVDLENFRKYSETIKLIDTYGFHDIWPTITVEYLFGLSNILSENIKSKENYPSYIVGSDYFLPSISKTGQPMDDIVDAIKNLFQKIIDDYKVEFESNLKENEQSSIANWANMLSNLLPGWYIIFANYNKITEIEKNEAFDFFKKKIEPLIKSEKRKTKAKVRQALDMLDLPFWKNRWHTYEMWSTINVLNVLETYKVVPIINGGRIAIDGYTSEIIADFKTAKYPHACVAIQVQTEIKIASKKAMKPDLRICFTNDISESKNTAAVVEFKQRKSIEKLHVEEVALRYTSGTPNSGGTVITNYDVVGIKPLLTPKSFYIEGVRPDNFETLKTFNKTLLEILRTAGFENPKNLIVLFDVSSSMKSYYKELAFSIAFQMYLKNDLKIYFFNDTLVKMKHSVDDKYQIITFGGTNIIESLKLLLQNEPNIDRLLIVSDRGYDSPVKTLSSISYRECLPSEMGAHLGWILNGDEKS